MSVNSITLVGRAVRDPEAHYYESGSVRVTIVMAVNRRSDADAPDLFPLELWGKQAQVAADYVRKGALIGVIGSLRREALAEAPELPVYVRVDRLELLGAPRESLVSTTGLWPGSLAL